MTNQVVMFGDTRLPERFWSSCVIETGGCWRWTGPLNHEGYGRFSCAGAGSAHRAAFSRLTAPIPPGLVIDHLCRNRACVNPAHMEPVTNRENTRRGLVARARSECPQGHFFTDANTYRWGTERQCRACRRAAHRRQEEDRKAAVAQKRAAREQDQLARLHNHD